MSPHGWPRTGESAIPFLSLYLFLSPPLWKIEEDVGLVSPSVAVVTVRMLKTRSRPENKADKGWEERKRGTGSKKGKGRKKRQEIEGLKYKREKLGGVLVGGQSERRKGWWDFTVERS